MDHIIGIPRDRCCWRRLQSVERENFLTINGFIRFMKAAVREESNTVWVTKILCHLRAIQGLSGGVLTSPEIMGYTSILCDWKEYIFHRRSSWNAQSILRSGLIPGARKENDKGPTSSLFHTLWSLLAAIQTKRTPVMITIFLRKHTTKLIGNTRCSTLDKIIQSTRSTTASLANEVVCDHHPQSCARRLHSQSDISKRRSSIIPNARNPNASSQGHAQKHARWNVRRKRSGKGLWKQLADLFKNGRWYWSQRTRSRFRCTLEKRSEWSRNLQSKNWIEWDFYSRRSSEREDDIQWRIKPCYLRDGQCGADWVEENLDSMSIMSAPRIWGYNYLFKNPTKNCWNPRSDVEDTDETCWIWRTNIISWAHIIGMHSIWMQIERMHCWPIQRNVRVTNFCSSSSNWKYQGGRNVMRKQSRDHTIWKASWRTKRQRNLNQWKNYHKCAHRLSSIACTWHDLGGQTFQAWHTQWIPTMLSCG